ncbi:MAG TPA: hypothetical protein VIV35_07565 [Chitinophagaceae bacterium]
MMKMNAGTWIGIIGGLIGLIVGIGAVIATAGSSAPFITILIIVVFGGMFYLFYRLFFKPMINAARLQKTGLPGKATILEVKDTGVTINNNPQVKLMLEVKNSYGQKYNTQCRVLVSRINPNMFMTGMELPVLIDPKNEQNVVIDYSGSTKASTAAALSQPNEAVLKAELEQVQKENEAISLSGRPARAIIKKYSWLGAYVNGNNPYVELELEILPENAASFSGKAKGVISEASVSKYQPGQEIFVKYDLYDNSKVVIDHSQ